jgi:hypothetical protein
MDGKSWHELASAPLTGPIPDEMIFGVAAIGRHFQVRVQDEVLIDTNDATYASGSVGLRVVNTHAAFADLHVMPFDRSAAVAPNGSSSSFMGN